MLKSYQDWPISAQLFWSEQRQTTHAAEQLIRQSQLEVRQGDEARDGDDQNGEDGSEWTESGGSSIVGDDSSA